MKELTWYVWGTLPPGCRRLWNIPWQPISRSGILTPCPCCEPHVNLHLQIPDKDGDEEDGKDEALVATDINLISVRASSKISIS